MNQHHHRQQPFIVNRTTRRADARTVDSINSLKLMAFCGPNGHIVLRVRGSSPRDEDEKRYIGFEEIKGYVQTFRPTQRYIIQRRVWGEFKALPGAMSHKVICYFHHIAGYRDALPEMQRQFEKHLKPILEKEFLNDRQLVMEKAAAIGPELAGKVASEAAQLLDKGTSEPAGIDSKPLVTANHCAGGEIESKPLELRLKADTKEPATNEAPGLAEVTPASSEGPTAEATSSEVQISDNAKTERLDKLCVMQLSKAIEGLSLGVVMDGLHDLHRRMEQTRQEMEEFAAYMEASEAWKKWHRLEDFQSEMCNCMYGPVFASQRLAELRYAQRMENNVPQRLHNMNRHGFPWPDNESLDYHERIENGFPPLADGDLEDSEPEEGDLEGDLENGNAA